MLQSEKRDDKENQGEETADSPEADAAGETPFTREAANSAR